MRVAAVLTTIAIVAGCSGPGLGLNRVQLSGEASAFPENYQIEAARVVGDRHGDLATAIVSYPRKTVGAGIASPQRWYVCISGLTDPRAGKRPSIPPALDMVDQWLHPETAEEYFVVLVFSSAHGRPSERDGLNSALCHGAAFEPIEAEPPAS